MTKETRLLSICPDVNGGLRFTQNRGQTVDVVRYPKPSAPNLKQKGRGKRDFFFFFFLDTEVGREVSLRK